MGMMDVTSEPAQNAATKEYPQISQITQTGAARRSRLLKPTCTCLLLLLLNLICVICG